MNVFGFNYFYSINLQANDVRAILVSDRLFALMSERAKGLVFAVSATSRYLGE
jgi:hypothetical protein